MSLTLNSAGDIGPDATGSKAGDPSPAVPSKVIYPSPGFVPVVVETFVGVLPAIASQALASKYPEPPPPSAW